MIDLIISATVGAIAGYGICAVMTVGRLADADAETEKAYDALGREHLVAWNALKAHERCADALATKQARTDRALACETPGANATVKRMARILRGDA